ncbi:RPA3B [Scenedesmus sp. PABB004]|nr:RPA3B [Scenedesmus sp. PABB004]
MAADACTPRVGFPQLKNMIGQTVVFVGKIESMGNGVVNMVAPDGSKVLVQANSPYDTQFAEITGVVVDPCTIREESHVNYGDAFDLNLYGEFLKLANGAHAELFHARA